MSEEELFTKERFDKVYSDLTSLRTRIMDERDSKYEEYNRRLKNLDIVIDDVITQYGICPTCKGTGKLSTRYSLGVKSAIKEIRCYGCEGSGLDKR